VLFGVSCANTRSAPRGSVAQRRPPRGKLRRRRTARGRPPPHPRRPTRRRTGCRRRGAGILSANLHEPAWLIGSKGPGGAAAPQRGSWRAGGPGGGRRGRRVLRVGAAVGVRAGVVLLAAAGPACAPGWRRGGRQGRLGAPGSVGTGVRPGWHRGWPGGGRVLQVGIAAGLATGVCSGSASRRALRRACAPGPRASRDAPYSFRRHCGGRQIWAGARGAQTPCQKPTLIQPAEVGSRLDHSANEGVLTPDPTFTHFF
jgi:hypothetical protein